MMSDDPRLSLPAYLTGELSPADRIAFEQRMAADPGFAQEVGELRETWQQLGLLPEEYPSAALRARFYRALEQHVHPPVSQRWHWLRWPALQAAAAAALFCLGLSVGILSSRSAHPHDDSADQLAQMRGQVQSLREMVALSLLDRQSAASRLQGVAYSSQVDQPNPELLSALQTALNHDPNVNVRLSSLDALERYGSITSVRHALLDSIPKQDSPLMQIALIDSLVNLHEHSAMSEFQRLSQAGQLNPAVRQRARLAMQRLNKEPQ